MFSAARAEHRRLGHVQIGSENEKARAELLEGVMSPEELLEPALHPGHRVTRSQDEQVGQMKVVEKFSERQLVFGFDLLILAVSRIGNRAHAAAREKLLSRAQIHGIAHATDVTANAAHVAAENRRLLNPWQARSAPQKRFENLGNVITRGDQERIDRPGG